MRNTETGEILRQDFTEVGIEDWMLILPLITSATLMLYFPFVRPSPETVEPKSNYNQSSSDVQRAHFALAGVLQKAILFSVTYCLVVFLTHVMKR